MPGHGRRDRSRARYRMDIKAPRSLFFLKICFQFSCSFEEGVNYDKNYMVEWRLKFSVQKYEHLFEFIKYNCNILYSVTQYGIL